MKNYRQDKRFKDVESLKARIQEESPQSGDYLYDYKLQQALKDKNSYSPEEFSKLFKIDFEDLPISLTTLKGLKQRNFNKMTEIQRCTIPHALAGRDIMAASKTGSGKTLSYLIPLIEKLYTNLWSPLDGLGGLIILPTRELAMQVFEVFNSITQNHILSVALLIGGKNYSYEKERIYQMNVLICTPGRLLQHMQESPGFDANEADQLLQMGFQETLDEILAYLPQRQTLLFSATLSKNIHQLSQLSLEQPELISLQSDIQAMPNQLSQYYMIVEIGDKLDVLFSFLKSHLKQKILIFLSTCKQVRLVYETFRRLKIGMPLFELTGRQSQKKRMAIFFTFSERKCGSLFTTNLGSRGLDFPRVDWVIQMDCPEDVQTYVHRVGRTARFKASGNSLLFLLATEKKMVERLESKNIKMKQIYANAEKQLTIKNSLQSIVSQENELKYLAQRAFVSYMRFVHFAPEKDIFNIQNIKINDLSESFGLVQTPVIKLRSQNENDNENEDEDEQQQQKQTEKKSKLQRLKEKIQQKKQQKNTQYQQEEKEENLEGGLFIKKDNIQSYMIDSKPKLVLSKRQLKKVKLDGHFGGKNKIYFDKDGNKLTQEEYTKQKLLELNQEEVEVDRTLEFQERLIQHAQQDKERERQRRKMRRLKRKELENEALDNE